MTTLQEAYDATENNWRKKAAGEGGSIRCGYCVYHNARVGLATDCDEHTCPLWAVLGNQCHDEPVYAEWLVSQLPEDAAKVLARLRELKCQLLEESC